MELIHLIYAGILGLLLCLVLTVFLLLVYSGLFHSIDIGAGKPPIDEVLVAYKFATGPYKESGHLFTELMALAPDNKCMGVYYDDPKEVAPKDTRYIVATILAEGQSEADKSLLSKMEGEGYTVAKFPAVDNAVKTTFPMKCSLSIFIAVARVYPRLSAYIKDNKLCAHPCIEIYDGKVIQFMAPLSRQEEFYVAETERSLDDSMLSEENSTDGDLSSPGGIVDKSADFAEDHKTVESEDVSKDSSSLLATGDNKSKGENSSGDKLKDGETSSSMNDSGVSSENPQLPDTSVEGTGRNTGGEMASDHSTGSGSSFEEIHVDTNGL